MSTAATTRLIPRIDEPPSGLTPRQETDATGAVARGLAEYLSSLSIDWWAGTGLLRFAKATDIWADYEDGTGNESASYPRAFVGSADAEGQYDGGLGQDDALGHVLGGAPLPATGGVALDSYDELTGSLSVEIHCDNPEQRRGIVAMLERDFRPYKGRGYFLLEMPHYFNARAVFTPQRITLLDNEGDAALNFRKARIVVQFRVPVIVARRLRPARAVHHSSSVTEKHTDSLDTPTVRRGRM